MTIDLQDRYRGSLIGQCLGDALGFPVEGSPPEVCAAYVACFLEGRTRPLPGRGPFGFGQYTDDSQLARELLLSLVERQGWQPEDYAGRIARLFTEGRIVGRGQATEQAALRLAAGVPWHRAGTPAPSAGNGSAMRAGPVGLWCHARHDQLVDVACQQGLITHQDPRCAAGSVAVAGAVTLALGSGTVDPRAFAGTLADWVAPVEPGMARAIRQLPEWLELPPAQAVGVIGRQGLSPGYHDGWQGISPFVTPSVLWSLYSFLRTPADYVATIRTAIAVGGDVDTTAAMAGAMSGAFVGLTGLPDELVRHLTDQGQWGPEDLLALADEALAICR